MGGHAWKGSQWGGSVAERKSRPDQRWVADVSLGGGPILPLQLRGQKRPRSPPPVTRVPFRVSHWHSLWQLLLKTRFLTT